MKLRDLYSDYIAHWISAGNLILRDKISSLGIKPSFDRFLTNKYVTKVWVIRYVPVYYDENLTEMIRSEMFLRYPTVNTTIQIINVPVDLQVTTDNYKRKLVAARERYNNFKEAFDQLSEADQLVGKTVRLGGGTRISIRREDVERLKERYDSFSYVYDHNTKGGEFFESYVFIQAHFESNELVSPFRKALHDLLSGRGILFNEVSGNVSQYLNNFGPATYIRSDVSKFPKVLLSDENVSHLSPYRSRGIVSEKGILMGFDVLSKSPLWVDYFASSAAQVIVVIARSGQGKTFAAQMASLDFVAQGHHVSVVDLKGGEWVKIKKFTDVLEIKVNRFVNTLRLDDLEVTHEDCEDAYKMAVSSTVQLLTLMVNLDESDKGNETDLEFILNLAVQKVYSQLHGFNYRNPATFHLTKNLKYKQILDVLEELKSSKSFNKDVTDLLSVARTRIAYYLDSFGKLGEFLDKEISLSEVIDHPFVIYSLDKNVDSNISTEDDIKVFMVRHLDRKKHFMRGKKGLHTLSIYEELQRSDEVGTSSKNSRSNQLIKFISGVVTGSRSDNVVVMLLLNSISVFDHPDIAPIRSNITTSIVGKLNEVDIEEVAGKLNCKELIPYIETISTSPRKEFRNCFAIKYDNGVEVNKTIYKVVVPSDVEEELRQRDVLD